MINKIRNMGIVSVLVGASLFSGINIAHAYSNDGKIDQGETILIQTPGSDKVSQCTVGYIEHSKSRIHTAGHCGETGQKAMINEENNMVIGTFTSNYNNHADRNDNGWVDVNPHLLGVNNYSGNAIVQANKGDKLCSYGSYSNKVYCSAVRGKDGEVIISGPGGIPGDSGGPAWIPGKGFVGVYSIYWKRDGQTIASAYNTINTHDANNNPPLPIEEEPIIITPHQFSH